MFVYDKPTAVPEISADTAPALAVTVVDVKLLVKDASAAADVPAKAANSVKGMYFMRQPLRIKMILY